MGRVQEKLRSPWAIGLIILCAFAAGFGVSFVSRPPAPPAEGKISISDFRVELPEGETVVTITSRDADGEELGRLSIYRRGDKIRDPQTSRFIGYEVRKVAVSEVSDRIEQSNSSARIIKSYEAVEVGDLVRREE